MTQELEPLLDLYATTVFLCSKPVQFPDFAIITANNPNGELLNFQENKKLNDLLQQQITQYDLVEIIGASTDLTHQEPSFAVEISLKEAVRIAKIFNQNAIFWVSKGEVFIVSAGLCFQTREIGRFEQKCQPLPDHN